MAANGTPQSYLYQQRPDNTTRDRSMEQQYTNSGNPYGYAPQSGASGYAPQYTQQQPNLGRYAPPQATGGAYAPINFNGGPYSYNLPNSNGIGMQPSGAQFQPQYTPPPGAGGPTGFNMGSPQTSQFNNYQPQQSGQSTGGGIMGNPQAFQNQLAFQNGQYGNQINAIMASLQNPQYNPQFSSGVTPNGGNQLNALTGGAYSGGPQPAQASAGGVNFRNGYAPQLASSAQPASVAPSFNPMNNVGYVPHMGAQRQPGGPHTRIA